MDKPASKKTKVKVFYDFPEGTVFSQVPQATANSAYSLCHQGLSKLHTDPSSAINYFDAAIKLVNTSKV